MSDFVLPLAVMSGGVSRTVIAGRAASGKVMVRCQSPRTDASWGILARFIEGGEAKPEAFHPRTVRCPKFTRAGENRICGELMAKTFRPPDDLGDAGRLLWRDLTRAYAFERGETAGLAELCRVQDRLWQVREQLSRDGLVVAGKRHPLADLEPKLSGQFRMLWRTLRLDVDDGTR